MEINLVFHILGLSKTKNENSIRDAYRLALKNNNPEDNPEGFKELRTAYEEALAYARTPDEEQDRVSPAISPDTADWINKVTALYVDLPSRWDLSKWKLLMEDDICQNIDSAEEIREQFFVFLMDHFHFPYAVWQYFDKTFYILDDMASLEENYPLDFLNYIKFHIEHDSFLCYEYFSYRNSNDMTCDGDAYIDHYLSIKRKMDTDDTKECYHLLDQLASFGVYHPYEDVERCRLLLLSGKKTEALSLISPLLDKYPDDFYIRLYAGVCKWENQDKESAADLWKDILEERPQHYYAKYYLSQYYIEKENYYEAKDLAISLLETDGEDQKVLDSLTKINNALIEILTKDMETRNGNARYSKEEIPIEIGWCLFQNQRFDEVISLLQDYTPTKDTEYSYCNLYGRILFQVKRYKDALPFIEQWYSMIASLTDDGTEETRKRISRFGMATYILSSCYSELDMLDKAQDILRKAMDRATSPIESLEQEQQLAEIYMNHQQYERSIDLCDEILKKDASYYPAYVIRLQCFYHLNQGQEVVDDYHRAIDIYPGYYKPYMFACEIFYFHGQYEDAKEVLEIAKKNQITLTPRMRLFEAKILRTLAKNKEDTLAVFPILEHLQEDRESDACDIEDLSEIEYETGLLYWDINRLQKAHTHIQNAIKENPERTQYQMVLGDILIQMGKYQEALEIFQKGKEDYEDRAIYHYNLGVCYENSDRLDEALDSYLKALEIDEFYRDCNEKVSDIYNDFYHEKLDAKWLQLSIAHATKQLEAMDNCYYRVNRGLVYMNAMLIEPAIHDFKKAIEFIPNDWAAWNNLGCCYKYLGDYNQAIECLQKAATYMEESKSRLPYSNMADCYEALFDYEKAISCYQKNLDFFPDDLSPWEEIGDLYSYMGKETEALDAYEKSGNQELIAEKELHYSIKHGNKLSSFFSKHTYIRKGEQDDSAKRYHLLGDIFFEEMADYKKAVLHYQKALQFPLDPETLFKYEKDCALAFYMLKQFDEAKIHANLALKAFENTSYENEEAYYAYAPYAPARLSTIGCIYLALGDTKKALELFSHMKSGLLCKGCRHPGCFEYHLNMGQYYTIQGDITQADFHFKKAIELNPHCERAKIEQKKLN